MVVEDTKIWTGCEFIYSLYDEGRDSGFYMCSDRINDLAVEFVTREAEQDAILACQDSHVRVVQGSQLALQVQVAGPVTALALLPPGGGGSKLHAGKADTIYATESGRFGLLRLHQSDARELWTTEHPRERRGKVNCMTLEDITRDGMPELVIGRDGGELEVYAFDGSQGISTAPVLAFEGQLSHSIRALTCGAVNSADHMEIIAAGYTGRLTSFTMEPMHTRSDTDAYGRSSAAVNNENRIRQVRKDLEALQAKLEKEKDRLSRYSTPALLITRFQVNSSFVLDTAEAAYRLSLEVAAPVDMLVVRSEVHLDLLDVNTTSTSLNIMPLPSYSGPDSPPFLATFRVQETTKRIDLKIRTTEGEYGDILITVVIHGNRKAAQVRCPLCTGIDSSCSISQVIRLSISPLSLHSRVHVLSDADMSRPRSTVTLLGNATMSVIHDWIGTCLPNVPPRLQVRKDDLTYACIRALRTSGK
jgi:Bardet-Biedl syndrome 7 protein